MVHPVYQRSFFPPSQAGIGCAAHALAGGVVAELGIQGHNDWSVDGLLLGCLVVAALLARPQACVVDAGLVQGAQPDVPVPYTGPCPAE